VVGGEGQRVGDGREVAVYPGKGAGWVEARSSKGCGGGSQWAAMRSLVRSATVSVRAQKYGGDSHQPMGRTRGKATKGSSSGSEGKATPRTGTSEGRSQTR